MRASSRVLSSIASLQGTDDFNCIVDYLKELLAEQDSSNRVTCGNTLFWGQGRAQCLDEIVAVFEHKL